MKYAFLISCAALAAFFAGSCPAFADMVYLSNGRSVEGIIVIDDANRVKLQVCSAGAVTFARDEISRVEKATEQQNSLMRRQWDGEQAANEQEQKKLEAQAEKEQERLRLEQESKPREIGIPKDAERIYVEATINGKVKARLLLDTGASLVVLSRKMVEALAIDLKNIKPDMKVRVADGRRVEAGYILLKNVAVQGVEGTDVDAAVLMEESGKLDYDGLLGMSFLKMFDFKINNTEHKLVLQKH